MNRGKIIFLNGVSSSGKTTIAKALIKKLPDYFHFSSDVYDIIIEQMEDRDNDRLIPVETEYFIHRTISMFSERGVSLIVDHILHDKFTKDDCSKVLSGYPILFVGVHCSEEELERREKERGDRRIGLSKNQLEFVHKNEIYDVEVNTFSEDMDDIVDRIQNALEYIDQMHGWSDTCKKIPAN